MKECRKNVAGSAVAKGDSGGGLAFKDKTAWFLRGIVSAGVPNSLTYSAFTNVRVHKDWMSSIRAAAENRKPASGWGPNWKYSNIHGGQRSKQTGSGSPPTSMVSEESTKPEVDFQQELERLRNEIRGRWVCWHSMGRPCLALVKGRMRCKIVIVSTVFEALLRSVHRDEVSKVVLVTAEPVSSTFCVEQMELEPSNRDRFPPGLRALVRTVFGDHQLAMKLWATIWGAKGPLNMWQYVCWSALLMYMIP